MSAKVVEGAYRTGHQEHIYIECQGMTAWFEGARLVVEGSMQCPYYVAGGLTAGVFLVLERLKKRYEGL